MDYPIPVNEAVETLSTHYRCFYTDKLEIHCKNTECPVYKDDPKRCALYIDKNKAFTAYTMAMHALRVQQINDNIEGNENGKTCKPFQ